MSSIKTFHQCTASVSSRIQSINEVHIYMFGIWLLGFLITITAHSWLFFICPGFAMRANLFRLCEKGQGHMFKLLCSTACKTKSCLCEPQVMIIDNKRSSFRPLTNAVICCWALWLRLMQTASVLNHPQINGEGFQCIARDMQSPQPQQDHALWSYRIPAKPAKPN